MNQQPKASPMGTVPIPKLLFKVAVPIMISMTIQALYNVIDSIFVSRVGENALNAVSLAYPVQNVLICVGVGVSVGMNAILSRCLGQQNIQKANNTAMHGLLLALIAGFCFLLFGLFAVKPYFRGQTDVAEILAYGEDYLKICCIFGFTIITTITLERTLQATGRTMYTMISQGVGAIVNIVLDPIFIFGYFGVPRLEVLGAAIATVIGQFVGLGLNIYFNLKHNKDLTFGRKSFQFSPPLLKEILSIAIPSMAMGTVTSLLVYGLNQIVMSFSVTATAVLGLYYKLQSFVFMAVLGLTNGMIPILAFNYGAKNYKRFMDTLWLGLATATAITTCGTLLFQGCPTFLIGLFLEENAETALLEMGVPAIKIIAFSFPLAGVCVVLSAVFQALGKGVLSLFAIISRQLLIQLPCAYLLAHSFGLEATWYSFVLAEAIAGVCMSLMFLKIYNKLLRTEKVVKTDANQ